MRPDFVAPSKQQTPITLDPDTLGNLQQSAQHVKTQAVSEVVPAVSLRKNRLKRAIPEYPPTDTTDFMFLGRATETVTLFQPIPEGAAPQIGYALDRIPDFWSHLD